MRNQRMMTWVSISGTAVSIFLIMVFFMADNLSTVNVVPELDRNLIYLGMHADVYDNEDAWSSSGALSYEFARKIYGDLDGVEKVSYATSWVTTCNAMTPGKPPVSITGMEVDGNFWEIYRFNFIEGRPFTEEECLSTTKGGVLCESLARRMFGTTDVVGREINVSGNPVLIFGVVKDVSPILKNTWAELYLTLDSEMRDNSNRSENQKALGNLKAILKYSPDTDPLAVKDQVISRYATINAQLEKVGSRLVYHETPYNAETAGLELYSNTTPDLKSKQNQQYFIYLLLILLPAVNLSSMTRGRLQHRISEIGVRRAFGARRIDIIYQLLGENFIVSLSGAIIGLFMSYLFMMFLSSEFFVMTDRWLDNIEMSMATPTFEMLFTWKSFLVALVSCFILNVLTATVPAWRAASVSPSQAISKSKF